MLTRPPEDLTVPPPVPSWAVSPPPPERATTRGVVVRAATAGTVAMVMVLLGHRAAAAVLFTVVSVVSVVSVRVPAAAAGIDRFTQRFQHLVGRFLTTVILTAVYVAIFVPVAAVLRLVRHDPLALGSSAGDASFWRTPARRPGRPLHHRPFTDERHPSTAGAAGSRVARGPLLRVRAALGLLVLLAAADLAAGAAIDRVADDPDELAAEPVSMRAPDVGARRGEPWAQELHDELARSYDATQYHPFRGWTVPDFEGAYVHVTDEARRSYQSPTVGSGPAVEVQFFGGSTTMGWFQRDEHTIPSAFARLAEADGIPVRVVNYGQPAYQNWQEVLLLQEIVSRGDAPDLAVFYDGANELGAQFRSGPSEDPIHLQSRAIEDRLAASAAEASAPSGSPLRRMYDAYAETSAVHRLVRSSPVEIADGGIQATTAMESPWPDQTVRPEERGRAAARLHGRGVDLARSLGDGFGFGTAFFWQPFVYSRDTVVAGEEEVVGSWGTDPPSWTTAYDAARADLHPAVVDISGVYEGVPEPLYYDFSHTNERGAELVAQAMYDRLRPELVRLHEADR